MGKSGWKGSVARMRFNRYDKGLQTSLYCFGNDSKTLFR